MARSPTSARQPRSSIQPSRKAVAERIATVGVKRAVAAKDKTRPRARLLIVHPSLDPALITKALGVQPTRTMKFGELVTTPAGSVSKAHTYRESKWSLSFENLDNLAIDDLADEAIAAMPSNEKVWTELNKSGARSTLILSIVGTKYQGVALSTATVQKLAKMKMRLGIEVYAVPQN